MFIHTSIHPKNNGESANVSIEKKLIIKDHSKVLEETPEKTENFQHNFKISECNRRS